MPNKVSDQPTQSRSLPRLHWCRGWFESSLGSDIKRYFFSHFSSHCTLNPGYINVVTAMRPVCDQKNCQSLVSCKGLSKVKQHGSKVTEQLQTDFNHWLSFGHSQKMCRNWLSHAEVGDQLVISHWTFTMGDLWVTGQQSVAIHFQARYDCLLCQHLQKGLSMHHPVTSSDFHSPQTVVFLWSKVLTSTVFASIISASCKLSWQWELQHLC